jgi:predicted permease
MGIPILQGTDFNDQDTNETPPTLIINETMARQFWPNQDPIGKRVSFQGPQGPYVIIKGVVKSGKYRSIGESPRPYMYLPLSQNMTSSVTLHVRTQIEPRSAATAIRGQVQSLDSNLPVYDVRPLTEHVSLSMLPAQVGSAFLALFGLIALLLACIGIYGITAFSVAQRTNEIGIRMALGAQAGQVLRLVMGQSMLLLIIGLVVGLIGAYALGGLIASFLYGISPNDPLTFAGVTLIFIAIALLACYIPARRAIRVDPVITLKTE